MATQKKLDLSEVKGNLKLKIQRGMSMDLCEMVKGTHGDILDFDVYLPTKKMNLQRPFVWSLKQKQELILSVLKGIEIQSISVIVYKDDITRATNSQIIKVIDGKQRISTLISFAKGEFPLNFKGEDYFIQDLSPEAKFVIDNFWFRSDRVYEYPDAMISDEDKIKWFELINFAGTPQDSEHLNKLNS